MLFLAEQAFVGRNEKRAPLKTPAWEAIRASVWSKNKWGGGASLGSATVFTLSLIQLAQKLTENVDGVSFILYRLYHHLCEQLSYLALKGLKKKESMCRTNSINNRRALKSVKSRHLHSGKSMHHKTVTFQSQKLQQNTERKAFNQTTDTLQNANLSSSSFFMAPF